MKITILGQFEEKFSSTMVSVCHVGVHDRVQNGWHNSFNTNIGAHHVNFWKFLTVIKKEEDLSRVKFVHLQQGCAPANPHRVYAAVNARMVMS